MSILFRTCTTEGDGARMCAGTSIVGLQSAGRKHVEAGRNAILKYPSAPATAHDVHVKEHAKGACQEGRGAGADVEIQALRAIQ